MNHPDGISNCVICLETSAGLGGEEGERAVAVARCKAAQPWDPSQQPVFLLLFFHAGERRRWGAAALRRRAQASRFLSPRRCTTPSAHKKTLSRTTRYLILPPTVTRAQDKLHQDPSYITWLGAQLLFLFHEKEKKVADEEKLIEECLCGERSQVGKLQARQQSLSLCFS